MPEIKERPILFSAPMVLAILDGRKTVTRREVKKRAALDCLAAGFDPSFLALPGNADLCPYGQPGDQLWVRETFALLGNEDGCCIDWQDNLVKGDERGAARIYRASCPPGDYGLNQIPAKAEWKPDTEAMEYDGAWRPSIHMPRWASRILLEITDVRVERLQDISRADIRAEGLQCPPELASDDVSPNYRDWYPGAWRELWESTGGDWNANPWVWVVEFKRVTP
ncbi:morphogenetic protein [Pseudomonas sp. Pse1]|uniref:morphogenetic protein n=1 Tax=Pseudomonas sp. Pse1 TaxID=2926020 RepID=UPI002119096D|nr:morphogenetic protein [Pseudomonas sp. Pse1]